jgi:hypothetical protein
MIHRPLHHRSLRQLRIYQHSESSSTSASSTQNPSPSVDDDGISTGGIIGISIAGGTLLLTLVLVCLTYIMAAKKAE